MDANIRKQDIEVYLNRHNLRVLTQGSFKRVVHVSESYNWFDHTWSKATLKGNAELYAYLRGYDEAVSAKNSSVREDKKEYNNAVSEHRLFTKLEVVKTLEVDSIHYDKECTEGPDAPVLVAIADTIRHRTQEVFVVVAIDTKSKVQGYAELFTGTLDAAHVYMRDVAMYALSLNAASIIIMHNHPSGDSTPSSCDLALTQEIKHGIKVFNIELYDHIVVGNTNFSFSRNGYL